MVALFGELHPEHAERWKLRRAIYIAEVYLEILYAQPTRGPQARALSRYPAVERDFSIMLPDGISFETVRRTISALGIPELVDMKPVEIFRGGAIEGRHYSLLLRVTLQSNAATLTEAELTASSGRIIQALEDTLGAKIRMSG